MNQKAGCFRKPPVFQSRLPENVSRLEFLAQASG